MGQVLLEDETKIVSNEIMIKINDKILRLLEKELYNSIMNGLDDVVYMCKCNINEHQKSNNKLRLEIDSINNKYKF